MPAFTMIVLVILLVIAAALLVFVGWQLSQKINGATQSELWLLALALFLGVMLIRDRVKGVTLSPGLKHWDWLWISALFVTFLVIGSYQLDRIPNSLAGDEGIFWSEAYTLRQNHFDGSFFDLGAYETYPLASSLYQAVFLQMFGDTLWAWRFSSVFAAALALIPAYLFAREAFNRRIAITACILMLVLPYFLSFARLGYNNSQAIFPVALCLYLLYAGLKRGSIFYTAMSGLVGGLGFYTYFAAWLGPVIGIVFLGIQAVSALVQRGSAGATENTRFETLVYFAKRIAIFVTMLVATMAPYIIYTQATSPGGDANAKFVETLLPNTYYAGRLFSEAELFRDHPVIEIDKVSLFIRPDLYLRLLVRGMIRTILAFHDNHLIEDHYLTSALPGPISVLFYTLGLIAALKQGFRQPSGLLLLWLSGGILLLSVFNTFPPRDAHLVVIIPVIAILGAIGLNIMADFVTSFKWTGRVSSMFLPAALTLIAMTGLYHYFVLSPLEYKPNAENIMAFDAIDDDSQQIYLYIVMKTEQSDFIPWMFRNMPNRAIFHTIQYDALANGQFILDPGKDYTIYFLPED
ncbi:MAG TPA: glycosyltransferase family 39 protein, partial [Phototrophicaceae bacterium]|nr:glycosyltransferase family 39 protein [Phototrophicaceae bacterium]